MSEPTARQVFDLFQMIRDGDVTSAKLQSFLNDPDFQVFSAVVDTIDLLAEQIGNEVSPENASKIDWRYWKAAESFQPKPRIKRENFRLIPFDEHELGREAMRRLAKEGWPLADAYDQVAFFRENGAELSNWESVVAFDSSTLLKCGSTEWAPCVSLNGIGNNFFIKECSDIFSANSAVLVRAAE